MNKIQGLISIARKAGFVIIGKEKLATYTNRDIPLLEIENLAELVSIENCKAIGLKNKALSESIEKCVKGE